MLKMSKIGHFGPFFAFFWTFLTFSSHKMVIRVLFESENFFFTILQNFTKILQFWAKFDHYLAFFAHFHPLYRKKKGGVFPISFSDRAQKVFAFEN